MRSWGRGIHQRAVAGARHVAEDPLVAELVRPPVQRGEAPRVRREQQQRCAGRAPAGAVRNGHGTGAVDVVDDEKAAGLACG
jgi:hypothetical protein|eukprot:COSAG01_NODE_2939_length_6824_cov_6.394349_4_plen_82_part_00